MAAMAGTSVTELTIANGFLHLARFSAYYQKVFGELPGQTLRRSQSSGSKARGVLLNKNAASPKN